MTDLPDRFDDDLAREAEELADAYRALAVERERYRDLFANAPVACLISDERGIVREANESAAELLGVPLRFLAGKPLATLVAPEQRRAFRIALNHVVATEGRSEVETRIVQRRGVPLDVRCFVVPQRGDGWSRLHWLVVDVTEQLLTERYLADLNAELGQRVAEQTGEIDAVLEQLPVGVVIVDAETGHVQRRNRRALEILDVLHTGAGAEAGDALDFRASDGTPLAKDERPVDRAGRGETVAGEVYVVAAADEPIWVELNAAPVRDSTGRVRSVVVTFDDVTRRELRERADREFVTNAAHELRSPIAAIASVIDVLQQGAKDDPAERDRFLAHIERESARLARLTQALLVLARAQRRDEEPAAAVLPVRPLLERIVGELEPAEGVEIEIECDPATAVIANPYLLEEALANVAANAAKYTSEGAIRFRAAPAARDVEIAVSDTGPGLDSEELERALERFYRGARTDFAEGFGLGLAIAREAVDATGGRLDVAAQNGNGTTVTIRLRGARLVRR